MASDGAGIIVALALVGLLLGVGVIAMLVVPGLQPELTTSSVAPAGTAARVGIVPGAAQNQSSPGYSPDVITVVIGVNSTVTWTNNDAQPHTVTGVNGTFDSGNMDTGQSFSYNFTRPGVYDYTCTYHPWMHGRVIVESAQGATVIIPQGAANVPPNWNQSHLVSDRYYTPSVMTVVIGVNNTVTWLNKDAVAHTVTGVNGTFDSGNMAPGQAYSYTFTKPGTYEYYCVYHPWMGGEVVVLPGQ